MNNSFNSYIFYVEESATELSPRRINTPEILNSTELPRESSIEHITLSSLASQEPQRFTIYADSKEPSMPYAYGRQAPIVPPSLNNLNLPANLFNILATMELVHPTAVTNAVSYSPPVAGANRSVSYLDASDQFQYNRRLRNTPYYK